MASLRIAAASPRRPCDSRSATASSTARYRLGSVSATGPLVHEPRIRGNARPAAWVARTSRPGLDAASVARMPARCGPRTSRSRRRGRPGRIDAIDEGARRPRAELVEQQFELLDRTLGDTAHAPAGLVRDPADEARAGRRRARRSSRNPTPWTRPWTTASRRPSVVTESAGHATQPSARASRTSSGLTLPSRRSPATSSRRSCDAANAGCRRAAAVSRSSRRSICANLAGLAQPDQGQVARDVPPDRPRGQGPPHGAPRPGRDTAAVRSRSVSPGWAAASSDPAVAGAVAGVGVARRPRRRPSRRPGPVGATAGRPELARPGKQVAHRREAGPTAVRRRDPGSTRPISPRIVERLGRSRRARRHRPAGRAVRRARRAATGASARPASTSRRSTSRARDGPEADPARTRADGRQQPLLVGGGEDDHGSGGRFLERLEEGRLGVLGHPVGRDDDRDARAALDRAAAQDRETRSRTPRSSRPPIGIVQPGAVGLEPVEVRMVAVLDGAATPARAARPRRPGRDPGTAARRRCRGRASSCRRPAARRAAPRAGMPAGASPATAAIAAGWPRVTKRSTPGNGRPPGRAGRSAGQAVRRISPPARPSCASCGASGAVASPSAAGASGVAASAAAFVRLRVAVARGFGAGFAAGVATASLAPAAVTAADPSSAGAQSSREPRRRRPWRSPRRQTQRNRWSAAAAPDRRARPRPVAAVVDRSWHGLPRPAPARRRLRSRPPRRLACAVLAALRPGSPVVDAARDAGARLGRTRADLRSEHRLDLRRDLAPRLVARGAWRGSGRRSERRPIAAATTESRPPSRPRRRFAPRGAPAPGSATRCCRARRRSARGQAPRRTRRLGRGPATAPTAAGAVALATLRDQVLGNGGSSRSSSSSTYGRRSSGRRLAG